MTSELLSYSTIENVNHVFLVLGKRLAKGQLTIEGRSRVLALEHLLPTLVSNNSAIVFCGGKAQEQRQSEASAMREFAEQYFVFDKYTGIRERILLEEKSSNSVENFLNALASLVDRQFCQRGDEITISLVSNDYHIERIMEIENLFPEQGGLGQFRQAGKEAGIALNVSLNQHDHINARYPYDNEQARAFLLLDKLTIYRVYLEGVRQEVFTRPLKCVRDQPYKHAISTIEEMWMMPYLAPYKDQIDRLKEIVELTPTTAEARQVRSLLAEFGLIVSQLRALLDPESN